MKNKKAIYKINRKHSCILYKCIHTVYMMSTMYVHAHIWSDDDDDVGDINA